MHKHRDQNLTDAINAAFSTYPHFLLEITTWCINLYCLHEEFFFGFINYNLWNFNKKQEYTILGGRANPFIASSLLGCTDCNPHNFGTIIIIILSTNNFHCEDISTYYVCDC